MRQNEEDKDPHQPEMPYTRCVIPSKGRSQPIELHRLVNRPAASDRKETRDRSVLSTSSRSVRRGNKDRQPPPMTSPARYTMPFSMNKNAHSQCRRRAAPNMPGPRLMWL